MKLHTDIPYDVYRCFGVKTIKMVEDAVETNISKNLYAKYRKSYQIVSDETLWFPPYFAI
jgi:hypothetical protein